MREFYYIELDLHKKTIAYCIKSQDDLVIGQGAVAADRNALAGWVAGLPTP